MSVTSVRTRRTAYSDLASQLRTRILQGHYAVGERLPTEAELVRRRGVSRQTVRRAFQDLVSEGMVYRVPGSGTFVAPRSKGYVRQFGSIEDLMALSVDTELEIVEPLHWRVDVAAAGRLRLDSDTLAALSFRRIHQAVVFCHTRVFLPPYAAGRLETVPELREAGARAPFTVIGLLDGRLDAPIAEAEQSITAEAATADIAACIGVAENDPVLRVDRVYRDTAGRTVELAISHFAPERYSYRVRLHRTVR